MCCPNRWPTAVQASPLHTQARIQRVCACFLGLKLQASSSPHTLRTAQIPFQITHAIFAYGHVLEDTLEDIAVPFMPQWSLHHHQHWLHHICWHHHNRRRHQHWHLHYWHRICHVMCATLARTSCPMLSRCSQHWLRPWWEWFATPSHLRHHTIADEDITYVRFIVHVDVHRCQFNARSSATMGVHQCHWCCCQPSLKGSRCPREGVN